MEYYDNIAKGYNELYEEEQLKKLRILRQHIPQKGTLLDVGAGTCFTHKIFTDCDIVFLDPSENMLNQGEGTRIIGGGELLPFKDETFDIVISVTALHHCHVPRAMAEIERVVKKNGFIGISMLKKAKNLDMTLFKDYKKIEEEKDFIFVKG